MAQTNSNPHSRQGIFRFQSKMILCGFEQVSTQKLKPTKREVGFSSRCNDPEMF